MLGWEEDIFIFYNKKKLVDAKEKTLAKVGLLQK
jgi:hypothetical protein